MKRALLLALCILAVAGASAWGYWARTWDTIGGYSSPEPARDGNNVWIGAFGQWPGDCVPDYASLEVQANAIHLDIYDAYSMEYCFGIPTDYDVGDWANNLPAGTYDVYVWQWSNLWPLPQEEYDYVRGGEYLMQLKVYYRGDITLDGKVNVFDLQRLAASWNKQQGQAGYDPACDLNGDNRVNVFDLQVVARDWNKSI